LDLVRNDLRLVSATAKPSATATFGFTVTAPFCNRLGALHGGAAALIFDICTSCTLAPIAYPGFWAAAGVSRTLNVTYLRPAPRGTKCLIECEVVHAGKRLCERLGLASAVWLRIWWLTFLVVLGMVRGIMKREEDGAVLCTAEHGKASIDPLQNSKL
jgi:uncharacterized protein (TIGR00369 family)